MFPACAGNVEFNSGIGGMVKKTRWLGEARTRKYTKGGLIQSRSMHLQMCVLCTIGIVSSCCRFWAKLPPPCQRCFPSVQHLRPCALTSREQERERLVRESKCSEMKMTECRNYALHLLKFMKKKDTNYYFWCVLTFVLFCFRWCFHVLLMVRCSRYKCSRYRSVRAYSTSALAPCCIMFLQCYEHRVGTPTCKSPSVVAAAKWAVHHYA